MAALTFAAIDVGSFEVEMGIYEISNRNRIRKLDHIRHVTALGSDTYNNGKISYEMVEELCDVLAGFAGIMKSYKVTEYRAYVRRETTGSFSIRSASAPASRSVSSATRSSDSWDTRRSPSRMMSLMRISSRGPRSWMWDLEACRSRFSTGTFL